MEHDQPSIGRFPRCRVIKGQVGLRQGQPLAYHLEPNWVHPQPRLEFPFTLRTTAEPLSPPEHRWRGRAVAVRHRTIQAHAASSAWAVSGRDIPSARTVVSSWYSPATPTAPRVQQLTGTRSSSLQVSLHRGGATFLHLRSPLRCPEVRVDLQVCVGLLAVL
jgi:hypothetical protein